MATDNRPWYISRKLEMIARCRESLSATNDPYWSDDRFRDYIWRAEKDIAKSTKGLWNEYTFYTATGTKTYATPGDCKYIQALRLSGTLIVGVSPQDLYVAPYPQGSPYAWARPGPGFNYVQVLPQPTASQAMTMNYVARPARAGLVITYSSPSGCTGANVRLSGSSASPYSPGYIQVEITGGTDAGTYRNTTDMSTYSLASAAASLASLASWVGSSSPVGMSCFIANDTNDQDLFGELEPTSTNAINVYAVPCSVGYDLRFDTDWDEAIYHYTMYLARIKETDIALAEHHLVLYKAEVSDLKKDAERQRWYASPPRIHDISEGSSVPSGMQVWTGYTLIP